MTISDASDDQTMTQRAPYPHALASLVERLQFKPGWTFVLGDMDRGQGSEGLTLDILVTGMNAYATGPDDPEAKVPFRVSHRFIVPAASFDERGWRRWLFDRCCDAELHEAMEFFKIDGHRPYAPNHGPGRPPYVVHERPWADRRPHDQGTEEDALSLSSGERNPNAANV